jgi:tRNA A37 threonylcarbamoyladenosine modification protein TsaB
VFAQCFATEKGSAEAIDAAAHLSPNALLQKYGALEQVVWAGEGAGQQLEVLTAWAADRGISVSESLNDSGWTIVRETNNLANAVAALALEQFKAGRTSSAEELHAVYVRASDAEINERWKQEKDRA